MKILTLEDFGSNGHIKHNFKLNNVKCKNRKCEISDEVQGGVNIILPFYSLKWLNKHKTAAITVTQFKEAVLDGFYLLQESLDIDAGAD